MKAAGYVRISSEEQAREGYGLAAQDQAIRAYCQAHSWELAGVYTDAGKSGKSTKGRGELARLLSDAQAGRFQRVVFWKLDRLGRNLRDLLDICDQLDALGVGIVSVQEAIDTGTPGGRMMRSVLGALAEFEREAIIERTKAGMAEKKRRGEWVGGVPTGFRREDKIIVPDPETAPLIHQLFQRYSDGRHSLRGLVSWTSQALHLRDFASMRYVLANETYKGAIIEPALFERVQNVLASRNSLPPRKPYGREPYPLSGIATCGFCTKPLIGTKQSAARYMRCRTTHQGQKAACKQPMVKAEILEEQVGQYVGGMRLPEEYVDAVIHELRRRRAPHVDTAQVHREMEKWRRLFVLEEIDEERLRRELSLLRDQLATVEDLDIERATAYLENAGGLWAESSSPLKREFVTEVFDSLEVRGAIIEVITPKPAYAPLFVVDRRLRFDGVVALIKPTTAPIPPAPAPSWLRSTRC